MAYTVRVDRLLVTLRNRRYHKVYYATSSEKMKRNTYIVHTDAYGYQIKT
jgi:hypothetical protein